MALGDPCGGELGGALAAMRAGSPPRGPGDSIPPIQHLHPSPGIILSPRAKDSAGKVLASGGLCGGDFARALAAEAPGRPCCARHAGQILPGPGAGEARGRGMRPRAAEARPCGRRARCAPRLARACGRGLPRRALPRPRGMLAPAAKGGFSRPGPAARGRGAPCGHARLPRPRGRPLPPSRACWLPQPRESFLGLDGILPRLNSCTVLVACSARARDGASTSEPPRAADSAVRLESGLARKTACLAEGQGNLARLQEFYDPIS